MHCVKPCMGFAFKFKKPTWCQAMQASPMTSMTCRCLQVIDVSIYKCEIRLRPHDRQEVHHEVQV